MKKILQQKKQKLISFKINHPELKHLTGRLLDEFSDALQPPLRRQINWLHSFYRLEKIALTKAYKNKNLLKKLLFSSDPTWSMMKEIPVEKSLVKKLAQQLFNSSGSKKGEKIIIAVTEDGRDIAEELIMICLKEGVEFELGIKDSERFLHFINMLPDEGLKSLADLTLSKYKNCNTEVIISSFTRPDLKKEFHQENLQKYRRLNAVIHERAMSGELHYVLTRIPTPEDAKTEKISYKNYLELFFELCDQPWNSIEKAQEHLIKLFDKAETLVITNDDGTHLKMSIKDMTFANSVVAKNIPGSEIFSAPVKNSVEGTVVANGRFQYANSEIMENITLQFKNGRLESFSAEVGESCLKEIIMRDDQNQEGTRYIGEIGIGTNPHLRQHVLNGLLVEKIGGSFHIALGSCYTYDNYLGKPVQLNNGNRSHSNTHWDLTTLLRGKNGKMYLDNQLVQENGEWLAPECAVLNRGWETEKEQPLWWQKKFPKGYTS